MKQNLLGILFLFFLAYDINAQVKGCTDPLAINYNSNADNNDGSCTYDNVAVLPTASFLLDSTLKETSGLIQWNSRIWTHNDDSDIHLYALDTLDGRILDKYPLVGTENHDWEEIAQDDSYIYIGDFGNNVSGNRIDLKILRIGKKSILDHNPVIDTIHFSYAGQNNLTPEKPNHTDFDCEAFVVANDSIFLFTKQWISNKTSVYVLPKIPGSYIARLRHTFDVDGLITGAVLMESERLVALSGYSTLLQPFVYLLYDFDFPDFFNGNKRKVFISLPFHQIEGITTADGLKYYLSNEYFSKPPLNAIAQQLHIFDLSDLLHGYLTGETSTISKSARASGISIYPNPVSDLLTITVNEGLPLHYELTNTLGKVMVTGRLTEKKSEVRFAGLPGGIYFLKIKGRFDGDSFVVVKR